MKVTQTTTINFMFLFMNGISEKTRFIIIIKKRVKKSFFISFSILFIRHCMDEKSNEKFLLCLYFKKKKKSVEKVAKI